MATPNYANPPLAPVAALNKIFDAIVPDLTITNAVTIGNLVARGRVQSRTDPNIDWDVKFPGANSSLVNIYTPNTNNDNSKALPAHLSFGDQRYSHRFQVSRVKMAQAATRGVGPLKDLFAEHIRDGLEVILGDLNKDINVRTDNTELVSIDIIADDTAAYAGIDPAVEPLWKPVISKSGTERAFSRDLMDLFDVQTRTMKATYDMVQMHPMMEYKYRKLFRNLAGAASLPQDTTDGPLKLVDLGLGESRYGNRPIILEPDMPDGQIRFLKFTDMTLWFFALAGQREGMPASLNEVINTTTGLPIHIVEYHSEPNTVRTFELYAVSPQLQVRNRRSIAAIKNISLTPADPA